MSADVGTAEQPDPPGRIARLRARADRAADHYQQLAQKRPLLGLPLAFLARYPARQGMLLASALAFRLFLWLMPLALLVAGILAGLSKGKASSVESATKAAGITGAASQQVITALHDGHKSWWVAVLIGAAAFLWTTRTLMRNLTVVTAHAWQVSTPRPRQKDVLLTTLLFAAAWIVIFVIAAAISRLDRLIPGGGVIVSVILETAVLAAMWLIVSVRLPTKSNSWMDLWPGCVLFGFGIAVMHAVSRVYLPRKIQHSSQLYGSLGVAAVILVWLLIIGQIIVSAALVNSVWTEYRAERAGAQAAQ
jgi:uncharacterized BrkB/YihY/UPF0761 family membrane protein